MNVFLGIDVGSVSTNLVVIDEDNRVCTDIYLRIRGQPIAVVQDGLKEVEKELKGKI